MRQIYLQKNHGWRDAYNPLRGLTRRPLHNRDSKIKATHNRDAQPESEAHAVKIRNRASEIMKTKSMG